MPGSERVQITGPSGDRYDEILTPQAIDLIAALHAELAPRRFLALAARRRRQTELSRGAMLDFLPETRDPHSPRDRCLPGRRPSSAAASHSRTHILGCGPRPSLSGAVRHSPNSAWPANDPI